MPKPIPPIKPDRSTMGIENHAEDDEENPNEAYPQGGGAILWTAIAIITCIVLYVACAGLQAMEYIRYIK